MMQTLLRQGYATLLGVAVERLTMPGIHLVVTPVREQPEWANWVHPIWFFKLADTIVCSASPAYVAAAQQLIDQMRPETFLDSQWMDFAASVTGAQGPADLEWVQCELLYYPNIEPPKVASDHPVEKLQPTDARSSYFLRNFDGGGYGIRTADGTIAAHACIKDKGLLQEIAVGTELAYRQRGMGKAVVAAAVAQICQQGKVPVYWPDSLTNAASYQLAYSLGFQKVAEMFFCCYAQPDWPGFPLETV
ncbi:MAG: GNAT family N-acetyltransferase [Caldilineaceae bacterium]|nr:GNAT family N-acetyltransferase [Caldilineaceae bacterium]